MPARILAFPPVAPPRARALILGSVPSVESLRQGFYYAHPRNAFWPILAQALGERAPADVPEKIALLERHDIALWDVLQSCERAGSLDSAIREPAPNDFAALFERCPDIRGILFNGGTSKRLFFKYCSRYLAGRTWAQLPSTSPAYTISYERKLALWRDALRTIAGGAGGAPGAGEEHESL